GRDGEDAGGAGASRSQDAREPPEGAEGPAAEGPACRFAGAGRRRTSDAAPSGPPRRRSTLPRPPRPAGEEEMTPARVPRGPFSPWDSPAQRIEREYEFCRFGAGGGGWVNR